MKLINFQHRIYFDTPYRTKNGKLIQNPFCGDDEPRKNEENDIKKHLFRVLDYTLPKFVESYQEFGLRRFDLYLAKDRQDVSQYKLLVSMSNHGGKFIAYIPKSCPEPYSQWLTEKYYGDRNDQEFNAIQYQRLEIEIAKKLFGASLEGSLDCLYQMIGNLQNMTQQEYTLTKLDLSRETSNEIMQDKYWLAQSEQRRGLEQGSRMFKKFLNKLLNKKEVEQYETTN